MRRVEIEKIIPPLPKPSGRRSKVDGRPSRLKVGRPVATKLACARAAVEATYFQLLLYTRAVKLDSLLYSLRQ